MVERGKIHRSNIFRACREQLAATNAYDLGSLHDRVDLSASIRVEDLSTPQCMDAFDVLQAAMKDSGQPTPPTDAQIESFVKLVLDHDKSLLQNEIAFTVGEQNFDPNVKDVVGVSKNTQEPVYGHLGFTGRSDMRYYLSLYEKGVGAWDPLGWGEEQEQARTISPNDVQFTCKEPTQWMSQLAEEARLKLFNYICNYNLLIAIKTARWCINVRLLCKEPYVPSFKHYFSLAGVQARPFIEFTDFISYYPFLAIICGERPRTVFDELSPGSEMLVEMMQKLHYKTEEAQSNVLDNSRSFGLGLESIEEEGEEDDSYEEGEDTCTEEEDTHEDGGYEYEDEAFDDEDGGW